MCAKLGHSFDVKKGKSYYGCFHGTIKLGLQRYSGSSSETLNLTWNFGL